MTPLGVIPSEVEESKALKCPVTTMVPGLFFYMKQFVLSTMQKDVHFVILFHLLVFLFPQGL